MHKLLEQLVAGGPVVTDGAWGTQLQARGLSPGECPDQWNLSHPDRVQQVARSYVEAGSQVILTNTFRANRVTLAGSELADQIPAINRAGVEISRRAGAGLARVFASIGPTGKMLITGQIGEEELSSAFTEQAQALAEAGADALVIETMAELAEAKLALAAAAMTGLPVVVSMAFDTGNRTMMGVSPEQAAEELTAAGADVIGANCGQQIAAYVPICRQLRAATDRPIWLKPNAGLPEIVDDRVVYRASPEEFATCALELVQSGASFLGGCCGTGPEFITALKELILAPPTFGGS